ncbi:MAG: methyl-accepting chemotaxis protein [Clostridiales bacterium]|jgi:methyl-accepting chemotaxis protein|nr:methyl-accepting chemotaxis protein [Clostridiales bacterium]
MKWFRNMKIGSKLLLVIGGLLAFLVGISIFSIYTAYSIDRDYSYMDEYPMNRRTMWDEVESRFHAIRRSVSHAGFFIGLDNGIDNAKAMQAIYETDVAAMDVALDQIMASLEEDDIMDEVEKADKIAKVDTLRADISNWHAAMTRPIIESFVKGEKLAATTIMTDNQSVVAGVLEAIQENKEESARVAADLSAANTVASERAILILGAVSIGLVLLVLVIAYFVIRTITLPIKRLVNLVDEVVDGHLNVNIDHTWIYKDEIGFLTLEIEKLINTILGLVSGLDQLNSDFKAGDIEAKVDNAEFKGSYKDVADGVNETMGGLVNEVLMFMNCMGEFSNGNFDADIPKLPGKKAVMNQNLEALRDNLRGVSGEIKDLVHAAALGELDRRIDIDKYHGDWAELLDELNALMKAIADPIGEASEILIEVSQGNFDHQVQGDYKGEFLAIKNSVNTTVKNVASYIDEISGVLDALADNDLNQNITREYVGKFSNIKVALLNIISTFNRVISEIFQAAEQVASGSSSISESSMSLAQGATEQASSIQELNATVQTITDSTRKNAEDARDAEEFSNHSKDSAAKGDSDMAQMLKAMDGIKESSNGISQIIKVIDDIAFQTNLLALNAAVEAARAGEHGKGFAVVAEEVRNLAARSRSSANETSVLIAESVNRINEGMAIADNTADALRSIVSGVSRVSEIITGIASASQEQAVAIEQVMEGIHQITDVVQNNSATSEETASASEQLSSQADLLRGLVDVFKLRA